ncbi:hypothetical protein LWI29_013673 [Acer saccharum]|uniref:Uncharacterized protein n=1 Tax=Acer saccharum TaxID=4024 RepID=A0AA39W5E3_ACESA|nr:hypothetical protein LWI29_013673 [Acer saccharum]
MYLNAILPNMKPSVDDSEAANNRVASEPSPSSNMDMSHGMFTNGTGHLDLNNEGHSRWHEADITQTDNEEYNPNDTYNNNEWPFHVPFAHGNVSTTLVMFDDNLVQPADDLLHSEFISLQVTDIMGKEFISVIDAEEFYKKYSYEQNPEIERTLHQLRRDQKEDMGDNIPPNQAAVQEHDQEVIQVPLNNLTRPFKDFTILRALDQLSCIILPPNINFEKINSDTIHLLPTFYGKSREDPYIHIKEFYAVCTTLTNGGVNDEGVRLRLFPFSLKDKDKDKEWLYSLPSDCRGQVSFNILSSSTHKQNPERNYRCVAARC